MFLLHLLVHNVLVSLGNPQLNENYKTRPPELNYGENFITGLNKDVGNPEDKSSCEAKVVKMASVSIKISYRPKGLCDHCCPINFKKDIRFFLYTKYNQHEGRLLPKFKTKSLSASGFKIGLPTVIFIHGFLEESPVGNSANAVKEAYFSRPEWYNVIILDWSNLSAAPWYFQSVQNVMYVGKVLANFLKVYHNSKEIPLNTVHLVGFSLGAHIAGYAGKYLNDLRISRITGLDVAFPLFPADNKKYILNKDDAEFVDIIHTNCGILGFPNSIGHVDFYPNMGQFYQPGCTLDDLTFNNRIMELISCSHQRAWELYAESVKNPKAFPSTACQYFMEKESSCKFYTDAFMGFNASRNLQGDYYLLTKEHFPYGMSEYEIQLLQ